MYRMYEWKCPKCSKTGWTKSKPKVGQFLYRAILCKTCKLVMEPTGQVLKKYSVGELL